MKGKKIEFSEEQLLKIIDMYNQEVTLTEIAKTYGVSHATISRLLHKQGLTCRNKRGTKVSTSEYENICTLYKNKMIASEIAKIYNVHEATIRSILKQMDIKGRSGGSLYAEDDFEIWYDEYKNGALLKDIGEKYDVAVTTISKTFKKNGIDVDRYTYHFDEHYFDAVDTPEKAYILGLLWADGCNCSHNNSIQLSLQEQDKSILDRINVLTQNERPLRFVDLHSADPRCQNQYVLTWHSKHLTQLLNDLGMCPKKTLVLEYPLWMGHELDRHFCRGYLDGDGCITLAKNTNNRCAMINMVGTRMFLEEVQRIIKDELDVDVYVDRDERARDPICVLRSSRKNDVMKILSWLYDDANIFMQRKYEKYQQFLKANDINNSCLN